MAKFKQMSAREAEQMARAAHRKEAIRKARKGQGAAPAYSENGGCPMAMLMLPWLILAHWWRSR